MKVLLPSAKLPKFFFTVALGLAIVFSCGRASAQNACTSTQTGMVAWWKLNETSGTVAADASGQNNPGQLTNHAWTTRAGNGAVSLASSAYLTAPTLNWQPNSFSVAWWVKPYATYNYNIAMRAGNGWGSFFFHTVDGGAIYVGTDVNNRLTANELPAGTVELNKWQHFAFTYANGTGKLYKNGVLLATRANMAPPNAWGGFNVGGSPTADGAFDDIRLYSRALTPDEAAVLASGTACPTVPVAASSPTSDLEYNWSETISYNAQGAEVGSGRQYVDERGRVLQNQVNDHATSQVLATQPVYDALGRPAIATLPAPINNSVFRLKSNFITSASSPTQPYSPSNFDTNPDNPDAVAASSPGTLGWYYSTNNTLEPDVAATAYPYSRVEAYADGTGETKRMAPPGDELRLGKNHESRSGTFAIADELTTYLNIRNKYFPNAGSSPATLKYHGAQQVSVTPQGTSIIRVQDESGHPLISALPNTSSQAWLTASNTVTLSQEPYVLTVDPTQPGFPTTTTIVLAVEAPDPINIRIVNSNNTVLYDGLNTQLNPFMGYRGFSGTIRFIANSYFTVDYQPDGLMPVYDQAAAKSQSYAQHQFYTLASQSVTVTAAPTTAAKPLVSYKLVNIATNTVVASGTSTNTFTLLNGFYKLICEAGDVSIQYSNSYEQASFSFYNQLGQLIGSLAPKGTKLLLDELRTTGILTTYATAAAVPYLTTYEYDQQGRLIARTEPDAGRSTYAYRTDGKVRFTQNSKQAVANKVSYVIYDQIGRGMESGEYPCVSGETFQTIASDASKLEGNFPGSGQGTIRPFNQLTYDRPASTGLTGYDQDFIAGHVSTTARYDNNQLLAMTWYSYDELGRTKWLVKQIVGAGDKKTIDYTYNELGAVATVCYQQNVPAERFTHYYSFDANRRLVKAETNFASPTDPAVPRTVQARYSYYLHGPLKRVEIGDDLQGVDYAYTAQGWLKNINHPIASQDPGQDGTANNRLPDLFSQSLDYYGSDDYRSAHSPTSLISTGFSAARYDGTGRAATWNIPGNPLRAQSFDYTRQNQLSQATYGLVNPSTIVRGSFAFAADASNRYLEGSLTYDANGNITHLNRIDDRAFTSFNSDYTFVPNTNKVDKLGLGGGIATQYAYNEIGETVTQVDAQSLVNPTASDRRFEYDAAGRITAIRVKLDSSPTPYLLAEYKYDEQGNCIYDLIYTDPADWTSLKRTSYVRDGSGNVLATYVYEFRVQGFGSGAQLQEQIVYGASRLGVYRRAYAGQPAEQLYEHYDHLGNTRVVYRRPTTTRYSLTMEDGRVQTEKNDFPDPANSPGRYDAVRSTNYSKSGLFSMRLGSATSLISPTKRLTVGKGDKVDMQVFAFYRELTPGTSGNRGLGKIGLAAGATGVILPQPGIGIDGQSNNQNQLNQLLSKVQVGVAIPLLRKLKPAPGARAAAVGGWYPAAQLQYDFTGTDGTVKSDYAFVTTDANNAWQQLNLSIDIDRPGTLDVYMVTQNGERVYFDDLTIDHKIGPIVQENNFYAYGMPMPGISWTRPNVRRERSAYQGLFAQYDEETKLNRFQLRMYDARTGRWLSKDPYGQYASPYVGMGNNPVNNIDPNGGYSLAGAVIRWGLAYSLGKDPGALDNSNTNRGWGFSTSNGTHYFTGSVVKEATFNTSSRLSIGVQVGAHISHLAGTELNIFSLSLLKAETSFKYSFEKNEFSWSDPAKPYSITPVWSDSEINQGIELDAPIIPGLGVKASVKHSFMYSDPHGTDKAVIEAAIGAPYLGYSIEVDPEKSSIEPSMSGSTGYHAILGADFDWKINYK